MTFSIGSRNFVIIERPLNNGKTVGQSQMPAPLETDVEILAYLFNVGANVSVSLDELDL